MSNTITAMELPPDHQVLWSVPPTLSGSVVGEPDGPPHNRSMARSRCQSAPAEVPHAQAVAIAGASAQCTLVPRPAAIIGALAWLPHAPDVSASFRQRTMRSGDSRCWSSRWSTVHLSRWRCQSFRQSTFIYGLCCLVIAMYVPRIWLVFILQVPFSQAMVHAHRNQYPATHFLGEVEINRIVHFNYFRPPLHITVSACTDEDARKSKCHWHVYAQINIGIVKLFRCVYHLSEYDRFLVFIPSAQLFPKHAIFTHS